MAFSKTHQEALKSIETRLRKLEVLSRESGIELDSWLPEVQFPDLSSLQKEQAEQRSVERSDLFKRTLSPKKSRV